VPSDFRYLVCYRRRSIPAPNLPAGAADAMSKNYYYDRDGRRECKPEMSVYNATATKAITAGGDQRCRNSFR